MEQHRSRFAQLHESGLFVMPNAWDSASAITMAQSGALAIATTSSGFAATFGRRDYAIEADTLLTHSALLAATAGVPVNVDSERCFGKDAAGVAAFVEQLVDTGIAGCSIEDFDPAGEVIDPIHVATERVAAAAEVCNANSVILTARAERHLYEKDADFDDTLARLRSFAAAGAGCLYAPGLTDHEQIAAVCQLGVPINILITPKTPTVPELAQLGVRRVSTGGALIRSAMAGVQRAVEELVGPGTFNYMAESLSGRTFDGWLQD